MKKRTLFIFVALFVLSFSAAAQNGYRKPPKEILDVLDAPNPPATSISPTRDRIALIESRRYPTIADRAEPMLRIGGLRINPRNTTRHGTGYFSALRFRGIDDTKEISVSFPSGFKGISPQWSPDGKYMAVGNLTDAGVELWIVDTATGKTRRVNGVLINTAFGGFGWEGSSKLSANLIPTGRKAAPAYQDVTPISPNIQETSGRAGTIATFQDLLKSPNDELLFEYYTTSQPAFIDLNGKVTKIGSPGIYDSFGPSPDGNYILVTKTVRPFSYLFPYYRFPKKVEVWDKTGKVVRTVADVPLQDALPAQGVQTGPRSVRWVPTEPATLMWAEALDGGDPRNKADFRDKLVTLTTPFNGSPSDLLKVQHRFQGNSFGERDGAMFYYDYDRDTQHRRMFMTSYKDASSSKLISDLNTRDRYNNPGTPVTRQLPNGFSVIRQNGDEIFLSGAGASPEGDRPFFRAMNLKTLETREIFRAGTEEYETFVSMIDDDGQNFFTRKESPTEPPNLYIRQVCPPEKVCTDMAYRQVTDFKDPAPVLRGITKELIQYKREDGVDLSFTLYLPPGYKKGERLPTVVWAYPLEYTDRNVAGQVSGSTNRFTQIGGASHLFFLLHGYAVLDNATIPIVGNPETVNDTFVKQLVSSAKAAIDKGVELGVVDPDRVGVGGHSYGAFMTANLLAHSDLFRAGIARSGAYNRTLTPFGFQSERRSFWEAKETYLNMSPFYYADRIKTPILLIHGEIDNNQGTFPMQSERMYAAIRGHGGTARLVMLPLESHGYAASESIEHTLYEQISWFDKHVKNAKPRAK